MIYYVHSTWPMHHGNISLGSSKVVYATFLHKDFPQSFFVGLTNTFGTVCSTYTHYLCLAFLSLSGREEYFLQCMVFVDTQGTGEHGRSVELFDVYVVVVSAVWGYLALVVLSFDLHQTKWLKAVLCMQLLCRVRFRAFCTLVSSWLC